MRPVCPLLVLLCVQLRCPACFSPARARSSPLQFPTTPLDSTATVRPSTRGQTARLVTRLPGKPLMAPLSWAPLGLPVAVLMSHPEQSQRGARPALGRRVQGHQLNHAKIPCHPTVRRSTKRLTSARTAHSRSACGSLPTVVGWLQRMHVCTAASLQVCPHWGCTHPQLGQRWLLVSA
jgi:hypothetical protein